jgi:acyl-[acyl-carrier-protein]-phospholipid O-acyltransferase/long-chain-fatty-acid--[acyl-carrier-protein] ligase
VLFSGYAGHMADVHSKRAVLIAVKIFEILVMGAAIVAFLSARVEPMFVIVFLMGLHCRVLQPGKIRHSS